MDVFGEVLDMRRDLITAGALVDCVLSHCWQFEEEGDPTNRPEWNTGIDLARMLSRWCVL